MGDAGAPTGPRRRLAQMGRCAGRVAVLLARRRLHLRREHLGATVAMPDGHRYVVYRETRCDEPWAEPEVLLCVWFRLRVVPPGARVRRWLFERESILNTVVYAGFDGYRDKLWMVEPDTSRYGGLYRWCGAEAAVSYAEYVTAILRPLSEPGSVGYQLVPDAVLDDLVVDRPALRTGRRVTPRAGRAARRGSSRRAAAR